MTSDERREVAEQLREARPSTYYAEELVELIEDALLPAFPTETWREPTDVLSALADLIDSTCSMDDKPNFFPECGARVVRDDQR